MSSHPPADRARLRRGLVVIAAATAPLAALVAAPRFVGFGIAVGAALTLAAAVGAVLFLSAFARVGVVPEGQGAPLWKRLDWLVLLVGAALFLPQLGAGGLWDPWETHYGEVARRMLERDDWISMWWENEWFYSKPVLIMWLQAIGMALVGASPWPDGQPFGAAWGMRLPVTLLAIGCMWAVYHFVGRVFSRRAGLVAAVALGTMPVFAFLAHQTMTDMPYVATMSIGICLLACALVEDDERPVGAVRLGLGRLGGLTLSPLHGLVALLVASVLPFCLYLLSRPMTYESGSAGQGNVATVDQAIPVPLAAVGLPALAGLGWLLWSLRRERRARRLYLLAAYAFVGLAVLAKVLPGLVLPGMVLFLWLAVTGRWGELRRLEIPRGLVVLGIVAMPWYLAKTLRHGQPFIDRIVFHDMVNRAVVGVHGDTGTVEYFVQQLGYGVFPWLLFVPLALVGYAWHRDRALATTEGGMRAFVAIWFFALFVFFSAVVTKFHHYIFPAVVPLALLVGLGFDDLMARRIRHGGPLLLAGLGLLAVVGADLARAPGHGKPGYERLVDLFIYNYRRAWPEGDGYEISGQLLVLVTLAVIVGSLLLVPRLRRPVGVAYVAVALIFGAYCASYYMPLIGPHWSQESLIREYYEGRGGPEERLVAYQMNWKGENFYTGNRVVVHVSLDTDAFERWVRERSGERHYFITERSRFEGLRSALDRASDGAGGRMEEVGEPPGPRRGALCNKFRMGVTTL